MLDFILAGVFALAAVYAKLQGVPLWGCLLLLILAGSRLYTGIQKKRRAELLERNPIVLNDEQRTIIADMKSRGDVVPAIKQVRLWYRHADLLTAKKLVDEV